MGIIRGPPSQPGLQRVQGTQSPLISDLRLDRYSCGEASGTISFISTARKLDAILVYVS